MVRRWTAGVVLFAVDDRGQDLVEYALLSGVIGTVGLLLYPELADRMRTAYQDWQSAAHDISEPCAPSPASCP